MTIPAQPTLTDPSTPPTRSDPATFAARGDAFLAWFPTAWTNLKDSMTWIRARAQEVFDWSNAAQSARDAAVAAQNDPNVIGAKSNGDKAAQAALDAQGYAAIAQAVSPDSPIRINTSRVTSDFTLASGYNAVSGGPLEIAENITVTISDNATWSII